MPLSCIDSAIWHRAWAADDVWHDVPVRQLPGRPAAGVFYWLPDMLAPFRMRRRAPGERNLASSPAARPGRSSSFFPYLPHFCPQSTTRLCCCTAFRWRCERRELSAAAGRSSLRVPRRDRSTRRRLAAASAGLGWRFQPRRTLHWRLFRLGEPPGDLAGGSVRQRTSKTLACERVPRVGGDCLEPTIGSPKWGSIFE